MHEVLTAMAPAHLGPPGHPAGERLGAAALQQRGEPLLPLILAHRAGALAFQPLVDCGGDQAGDRLTALSTELTRQTELPVIKVDVRPPDSYITHRACYLETGSARGRSESAG